MPNTEHLYVHDNLLTGTLPESIMEMSRLRKFQATPFSFCHFIGIPDNCAYFSCIIEKLRVYWNEIQGTVPDGICGLMEYKLSDFQADCAGDEAQLACTCCTKCYA